MHRFGAIGCDVIVPAGHHNRLPQSESLIRIHADFKSEFTAKADAADPGRNSGHLPRLHTHERKCIAVELKITTCPLEHGTRVGSCHTHYIPLISD